MFEKFKKRYQTWESRGLLAGLGFGTIASVIFIAIVGIAGSPFTGGTSGVAALATILYILGTAASCGAAFKYFGKGVDAIVEIHTSKDKNTSNSKLATLCGAIAGIIFATVMLITGIISGPLGAVAAFFQVDKLFTALLYPIIVASIAHFCGSAAEKLGAALDSHPSKEQKESSNYQPEPDNAFGVVFFRWLINKFFPAKNDVIAMDTTPAQPLLASENATTPAAAVTSVTNNTPAPAPKNSQKNILRQLAEKSLEFTCSKSKIKADTKVQNSSNTSSAAQINFQNIPDTLTTNSEIKPLPFWKTAASMFCTFFISSQAQSAEGGNANTPSPIAQ